MLWRHSFLYPFIHNVSVELSKACREAGGFYDPRTKTCKLGNNYIREVDPYHYEIVTPVGRFEVNGYRPRVGQGVLFPFNNCGIDVTRAGVYLACYAWAEDGKLGAVFENTFSGEIFPYKNDNE